jgi:DNA-binding response OmpR family regulator
MDSPLILIVEDEILVALMVEEAFAEAGFRIAGLYRSGAAAMDHVRRAAPDILLLDVILQGELSGLDVARSVRTFWSGPIVFHTSASDPGQRELMASIPNATVVLKPATRTELLNAVRSLLPK